MNFAHNPLSQFLWIGQDIGGQRGHLSACNGHSFADIASFRISGAEVYVEYVQNDNVTNISARRVQIATPQVGMFFYIMIL